MLRFEGLMEEEKVTALLRRIRCGDAAASGELMPAIYQELRSIAGRHFRKERPGHTIQPTALVNEAWLRLFGGNGAVSFEDRAHFLAVASRVMRRILVDHARARASEKRGGDVQRVPLQTTIAVSENGSQRKIDFLDLDLTLETMTRENAALGEVIELNYFGGMTAEEIAETVGRTVHTVRHEIRFAQAWLRRELAGR
jgi:RNA polymerase sigma factor (TIGR02999 family)